MKPTRSLTFCREGGRKKMLFESESKANNFIKFNADEIRESTGYAPTRSYYCISCGGWHVTHMAEFAHKKTLSEVMTDKMNKELENKKRIAQVASQQRVEIRARNKVHLDNIQSTLDAIHVHIESGDMDAAKEALFGAYREFQTIMDNDCSLSKRKIALCTELDNMALYLGVRPIKIKIND